MLKSCKNNFGKAYLLLVNKDTYFNILFQPKTGFGASFCSIYGPSTLPDHPTNDLLNNDAVAAFEKLTDGNNELLFTTIPVSSAYLQATSSTKIQIVLNIITMFISKLLLDYK